MLAVFHGEFLDFARAALGEMIRAAQELKDRGTYAYSRKAIPDSDAARQMRKLPRTEYQALVGETDKIWPQAIWPDLDGLVQTPGRLLVAPLHDQRDGSKMTKDPEIQDLLNKEPWHSERKRLRALLLACDLDETVKWGKLCYAFEGGNVAIIYGLKNYCAIGFFKGSILDDPEKVLVQPGKHSQAMRQLRFKNLNEIEDREAQIAEYVGRAIQAEKDGLDVDFAEKDNLDYPDELQDALDDDPDLAKAFEDLTPGRQRGYVLHISDAKASETRARRTEKARSKIMKGKGLNER